jgi:hypothetical protein
MILMPIVLVILRNQFSRANSQKIEKRYFAIVLVYLLQSHTTVENITRYIPDEVVARAAVLTEMDARTIKLYLQHFKWQPSELVANLQDWSELRINAYFLDARF